LFLVDAGNYLIVPRPADLMVKVFRRKSRAEFCTGKNAPFYGMGTARPWRDLGSFGQLELLHGFKRSQRFAHLFPAVIAEITVGQFLEGLDPRHFHDVFQLGDGDEPAVVAVRQASANDEKAVL